MERIKLSEADVYDIRDGNDENEIGCGFLNDDERLYIINAKEGWACLLPEKYQGTPLYLYPPCGGYGEGLIMVSLLGEIDLQYYHHWEGASGIWGWIDINEKEIIKPQYIFAFHFYEGKAIVCKGEWKINNEGKYWCEHEKWGIIDKKGKEIVPCMFDELSEIDNTTRYILCHKGGWEKGNQCIYDAEENKVVQELDFSFDTGYMFNECFYKEGCIFFDEHIPGEEKDYIYVYSLKDRKWLVYHEIYEERELNGERKVVVNVDGKDIIIF